MSRASQSHFSPMTPYICSHLLLDAKSGGSVVVGVTLVGSAGDACMVTRDSMYKLVS